MKVTLDLEVERASIDLTEGKWVARITFQEPESKAVTTTRYAIARAQRCDTFDEAAAWLKDQMEAKK